VDLCSLPSPPSTFSSLCISVMQMPTSGDLKSSYRTPPPPRKRRWDLLPIKLTSMPPNRLSTCDVHLNLIVGKKGRRFLKTSEDFLSWPKVELKSSEDFPMLAQRIRKVSKVHQSILKTNRFLIYWLTEIQSHSLLYGRENEESVCLVSLDVWFLLKRLLDLKIILKKRQVEFKRKKRNCFN